MIEAVIKNKSRRWFSKGINIPSASVESKIPREDEVTSTIFGTMKYFDPKDIFKLFNAMSGESDIRAPLSMNIELWPKSSKLKHRTRVEPDAIFLFEFANSEKKLFILEVKWLGYEYSENQLEDQWAAFGSNEPANSRLIYLSNSSAKFDQFKSHKNSNWKAITWGEFSTILSKQLCYEARTSSFFQDVHQMLNKFNGTPFKGFNDFAIRKARQITWEVLSFNPNSSERYKSRWSVE